MASKPEVLRDIDETLGFTPEWLAGIPEHSIEAEWSLMKNWEMIDSVIPSKYKALIGLAVAANMACDYCILYHTEVARLHGATDEEIEDACHMAKMTSGWSSYLNGLQIDVEQFRDDVRRICEHARAKGEAA